MGSVAGILCVVFFCNGISAQSYFYKDNIVEPAWLLELGAGAGIMNCRSDLGGKNGTGPLAIDWQASRFSASLLAAATYRQTIGFRIQLLRGSIGSADSLIGSGGRGSRYDRNLHFRSSLSEVIALLEFYPFSLFAGAVSMVRLQVFVTAGAGWYWFNPRALVGDRWVNLQPLHTEAQHFRSSGSVLQPSYKLSGINVPIGLGFRWEAGPFLHLRLEALHRILFTDYLDDVSTQYADPDLFALYLPPATAKLAAKVADRRRSAQPFSEGTIRGSPDKNDAFFHLQLSASVLLNRKKLH